METEYIEKQTALDRINQELRCGATADQCGLETAYDLLHNFPPADVRPVIHGHWLWDGMTRTCSVCGQMRATDKRDNYCPSCGADMREVDNGSET